MWKGSMGGRVQSSRMEGMRLEIEEPRLRPRSRELMLRLGRELTLRLWIQQVELAALPPKPRLAGRCSWRRSLQLDWNIQRLCACPPLQLVSQMMAVPAEFCSIRKFWTL